MVITKDSQADLYCLKNHQFLRTFANNYGPYKDISMAAFSNRTAVIFACEGASVLLVIPDLLKSNSSLVSMKRLGAHNEPSDAPCTWHLWS